MKNVSEYKYEMNSLDHSTVHKWLHFVTIQYSMHVWKCVEPYGSKDMFLRILCLCHGFHWLKNFHASLCKNLILNEHVDFRETSVHFQSLIPLFLECCVVNHWALHHTNARKTTSGKSRWNLFSLFHNRQHTSIHCAITYLFPVSIRLDSLIGINQSFRASD